MMPDNTNKENLRKLLAFLREHIINKPENAWFVDELRKSIGESKHQITGLENVEKYLGLDYSLDDVKTIIDYDFIENDYIRNCFQSDCREMLRYRYGTRGHKINFGEFCRYALIQVERLLNVYYTKRGPFIEVRNHISSLNHDSKGKPFDLSKCNQIESIAFAAKLKAFVTEFNLSQLGTIFDRVREVRNLLSHGDIAQQDEEAFFYREYQNLLSYKFPMLPNGWVNWNLLNQNIVLKNIYTTQLKNTPNHKRYILIAWKRTLPFTEVIDALDMMATFIKSLLVNHE